jgi:hypothetical protein
MPLSRLGNLEFRCIDAIFNEEEEGNSQWNLLYLTDSRYEDTIASFKAKKDLRAFLYLVICPI